MNKQKITQRHIEMGLARLVERGGHIQAEWAPAGTQLKMPMRQQEHTEPHK